MTYFNWKRMLPSDMPRFGCTPGKVIVPPRPFLPVRNFPPKFQKPHLMRYEGYWIVVVAEDADVIHWRVHMARCHAAALNGREGVGPLYFPHELRY